MGLLMKMKLGAMLAGGVCLGLSSCLSYTSPEGGYGVQTAPSVRKIEGAVIESGSSSGNRYVKPTVSFPARVAVARVEKARYGGAVKLFDGQSLERPEHVAIVSRLPGVRGMVSLNNVSLKSGDMSYESLRSDAQNVGADLLAVYRFTTNEETVDHSTLLTTASLGILPTQGHQVVSNVSLILQDAQTGYTYGVLEKQAAQKRSATGWGLHTAVQKAREKTRQEAFDALMQDLPAFWSQVAR